MTLTENRAIWHGVQLVSMALARQEQGELSCTGKSSRPLARGSILKQRRFSRDKISTGYRVVTNQGHAGCESCRLTTAGLAPCGGER